MRTLWQTVEYVMTQEVKSRIATIYRSHCSTNTSKQWNIHCRYNCTKFWRITMACGGYWSTQGEHSSFVGCNIIVDTLEVLLHDVDGNRRVRSIRISYAQERKNSRIHGIEVESLGGGCLIYVLSSVVRTCLPRTGCPMAHNNPHKLDQKSEYRVVDSDAHWKLSWQL